MTDLLSPSSTSTEGDGVPAPSRLRVVLDTSVLVADPGALHAYAGSDIVIPLTVIEELDSLKSRMDDVGRAARTARSTSAALASATSAIFFSVAGLIVSKYFPDAGGTNLPSMNACVRGFTSSARVCHVS